MGVSWPRQPWSNFGLHNTNGFPTRKVFHGYLSRVNLLKVEDIYNLEIGKIMHKILSGSPPDNFKQLFIPFNQIHPYATRSATRGAFFWQAASNKHGKRSLKHLGPKIWDCINPSLYELSSFTFKKRYRDNQGFSRRFRDPIRVPTISNRVTRITENYHWVPKIRENRVPRIREIGSLQIHIGYLTFSLKKTLEIT